MKLKNIKQLLLVVCIVSTTASAWAQSNTLYFMRGIPERSVFNPAFQPESDWYLELPFLPTFSLGGGNNSLVFNDVIFNKDGKTMTFLDENAGSRRDAFYDALHNNTRLHTNLSYKLLGFGLRKNQNYFSFDVTQKSTSDIFLPKDLFSFGLYGMEKASTFDLTKVGVQASLYMEIGVGWSRKLNDKLTVGAKLKYLIGQANVHTSFNDLKLTTNRDEWTINGTGKLHASLPYTTIPFKDAENVNGQIIDFDNIDFKDNLSASDILSAAFSSNWGLGVDLGVTYQLLPNLQLSAALTDLGFIRWSKNLTNSNVNSGYTFTGADYDLNEQHPDGSYVSIGDQLENQLDSLKNSFVFSNSNKAYSTALSTRFNLGAEYSILNDKISFGLMSSTLFINKSAFTDVTASANFRPLKWFHPSLSYSLLDGQWSSFGLGTQLKLGVVDLYLAVDQIPLRFSKTTDNMPVPTHLKGTNIQAGFVLAFGPKTKKVKKEVVEAPAYFEPVYVPKEYVPEDVLVDEIIDEIAEVVEAPIAPVAQPEIVGVIEYATNEYKIDPNYYGLLKHVIAVVSANPDYNLIIEGHTDNTGQSQANQALSEKRAGYVQDYLMREGLDPTRLSIVGSGDREPVASNDTAEGRAQNRRVNFVLKLK
ncbi:MAG: DUF5723 family protein [Candidatus Symbiothrix sp.]|jgi:outer membrane protein OmpA-like peptidoglycan-associated protein|nr:DUF5723 family protein [Candidatus Symbiothrix sp.]